MDIRYPRTSHLDGSGVPPDAASSRDRVRWADLAEKHVVIEEKMDGSETSFEFDADAEPILRFRGSPLDLSIRGGREKPFDRLKDWFCVNQDPLFDLLSCRYRVYGEWLYAAHRIFYDRLPAYFLEFDILDKEGGVFLDTPSRRALIGGFDGLHSVRVIAAGMARTLEHPSRLDLRSAFRSDGCGAAATLATEMAGLSPRTYPERFDGTLLMEGVYGKIEEEGRVVGRFKWVRQEFVRSIVDSGLHWRTMPLVANIVL
jgi:hypothetical protein